MSRWQRRETCRSARVRLGLSGVRHSPPECANYAPSEESARKRWPTRLTSTAPMSAAWNEENVTSAWTTSTRRRMPWAFPRVTYCQLTGNPANRRRHLAATGLYFAVGRSGGNFLYEIKAARCARRSAHGGCSASPGGSAGAAGARTCRSPRPGENFHQNQGAGAARQGMGPGRHVALHQLASGRPLTFPYHGRTQHQGGRRLSASPTALHCRLAIRKLFVLIP